MELAGRQMATLGGSIEIQPHDALISVLRATAGHVQWLSTEIQLLDSLQEEGSQVLFRLYSEERDRLARVAKACIDSGVSEKQVEFEKRTTAAFVTAIERAFREVNVSPDERRRFGEALRVELEKLQPEGRG